MKRLLFIVAPLFVLGIVACEPPVTFTEPQPVDKDNLPQFPTRIQGSYTSLSNQSTLVITDKCIVRSYSFYQKSHQDQLESTFALVGDTLTDTTTGEKTLAQRDGDSLILHIVGIDTLFQLDSDHLLRRFKGHYFLNKRSDNATWEVQKMSLSKGQLVVSGISSEQEIENLKAITKSTNDTVAPYVFAPTKQQFKEFVKQDGFGESEVFIQN